MHFRVCVAYWHNHGTASPVQRGAHVKLRTHLSMVKTLIVELIKSCSESNLWVIDIDFYRIYVRRVLCCFRSVLGTFGFICPGTLTLLVSITMWTFSSCLKLSLFSFGSLSFVSCFSHVLFVPCLFCLIHSHLIFVCSCIALCVNKQLLHMHPCLLNWFLTE